MNNKLNIVAYIFFIKKDVLVFFLQICSEYKVISFSEFAWEYKVKSFSKVKVVCRKSKSDG